MHNNRIKYVNPRMLQMSGYELNEVIGKNPIELLTNEEADTLSHRFSDRIAGENVPEKYQTKLRSKSGDILDIQVDASLVKLEVAQVVFLMVEDLTNPLQVIDSKLLREYAENSHSLDYVVNLIINNTDAIEVLLNRQADGVMILHNNMIKYANTQMEHITGKPQAELIGTNPISILTPEEAERMREQFHRRMAGEDLAPVYTSLVQTPTGEVRKVLIHAGVVPLSDTRVDFVYMRVIPMDYELSPDQTEEFL